MMLEFSTKQYTISFRVSWGVQHLKTAPCTAYQSQSSIRLMTISHITGADPLPCPIYFGGGLSSRVHLPPL